MSAYTLVINQGSTFARTIAYSAGGLTGATARLVIRKFHSSPTAELVLTTGNGLTITADDAITVAILATQTAALDGPGVYSLEVTFADGSIERILEGDVYVVPDASPGDVIPSGVYPDPIFINKTGHPDPSTLPIGRPGSAHTGISIVSSDLGGEDEAGGTDFDSTGRLNLYSYQRAEDTSYGEVVRMFSMENQAKTMVAWYVCADGYDPVTGAPMSDDFQPVSWIGAHWAANDDPTDIRSHAHVSIEIPDSTGALQTRMEFPFIDKRIADPTAADIGSDLINIRTNNSDFTVTSNEEGGVLRVGGAPTYNKDIEFSTGIYGDQTNVRWRLRTDTTTEAGNVGSDFRIMRRVDSAETTTVFLERSTGNMALGRTTTAGKLDLANTLAQHGIRLVSSTDIGSNAQIYSETTTATQRVLDARVTGDSVSRLLVTSDGKIEWGPGNSTRDTNLFRAAADELRTDDSFTVGANFRIATGSTPASATATGTAGQIRWDGSYIYVATSTNQWKRAALATW